ncbi:MAG: hypothetical protein K0R38_4723 [Polyangiaceae bacterium]|nr:hypothetical protein [Polyangiaceae bacterium]
MRLGVVTVGLGAVLCATRGVAAEEADAEEWSPSVEEARAPHHGRSLWQMGAGLAIGTGGYWALMRRNVADWDNPRPLSRFDGSSWVLDNNSIGVNFLGHPYTGGISYALARGNHQSVAGAFAYSFLTSFLWEFVIEFKEKVSVNDVLVTPGAGLPIGEAFHKLGLYLDTGHHDSVPLDVLRALFGTGAALDRALDGRPAPRVRSRDALGFSSNIWHEFAVDYGVAAIDAPGVTEYARYQAGLALRLVTLQGYGKPLAFGRGFHGAELSTLAVRAEASPHGWGLAAEADTVLAGYHAQSLTRRGGALEGELLTIGTSLGFDYLRSSANRYGAVEAAVAKPGPDLSYHAPNRREQYGAFQLPGIALDLRVLRRWGRFEASGRLQPSFAGLGAVSFYDWAADHLEDRSKHVLHRQGYFYGWGGAAHVSASVALGALRGGFELTYGAYRSQDGWDRHAERLSVDVPVTGNFLTYRGRIGVAPSPSTSVAVTLGVRRFRSDVDGYERTARAVERGLAASWVF